jgi:hypothetical protein
MLKLTPWEIGRCLLLIVICMTGFNSNGFADDKKKKKQKPQDENTIIFKGNTFELQPIPSMAMEEGGGSVKRTPIKLNGEPIYTYKDINRPPVFMDAPVSDFKNMVGDKMQEAFSRLKDGTYILTLGTLVLDDDGKVVYYDPHVTVPDELAADAATQEQVKRIKEKVGSVLAKFPSFTPAERDGKEVAFYLTQSFSGPYKFVVNNRKVEYVK